MGCFTIIQSPQLLLTGDSYGQSGPDFCAATGTTTLACMHGSAWHGDGSALLRALTNELSA